MSDISSFIMIIVLIAFYVLVFFVIKHRMLRWAEVEAKRKEERNETRDLLRSRERTFVVGLPGLYFISLHLQGKTKGNRKSINPHREGIRDG